MWFYIYIIYNMTWCVVRLHYMLYINFPKKGAAQTFLRGRSNAGFAGVWAGRELTFGQHLFSENWKVKIEEEKGWKKECENAFCKIWNWECKMPCEKKRRKNAKGTLDRHHLIKYWFLFSSMIHISIFHKRKNRNLTCWDRQKNLRKMIWRKIL